MNKLQKIPFTQLTRNELITLCGHFVSTLKPLYEVCPFTKRNCQAIEHTIQSIDTIEGYRHPAELIEEKRIIDAQMDKLLITCRDSLRSNAQLEAFMPEKAAASAVLYNIFEKRPNTLYHGGYAAQEGEVQKLFAELFDPINDENREQSGISLIFNTLRDTFDALLQTKVDPLSREKPSATINDQLALLRYRLEKLHSFIDGNCFDEIPEYLALESTLNATIQLTMTGHHSHKARKKQPLEDVPFN